MIFLRPNDASPREDGFDIRRKKMLISLIQFLALISSFENNESRAPTDIIF